eukprot:14174707-Heterocapsa_arctica.AAC.1
MFLGTLGGRALVQRPEKKSGRAHAYQPRLKRGWYSQECPGRKSMSIMSTNKYERLGGLGKEQEASLKMA